VHVDPEKFPPAPVSESYRARLHCSKCGGRGASAVAKAGSEKEPLTKPENPKEKP